jgi:hypothetical protein
MATINELKGMATSKLGFARSNSYLVELPPMGGSSGFLGNLLGGFVPSIPGLTGSSPAGTRELNVLCKNAQIPGKQILTADRRIGMRYEKVAYGYAVGDVSLTFMMMNDYSVMTYFDEWKKLVLDEENYTVGYKRDYAKPVKIHQLRKPQIGASFGAGPISVNIGVGGGSVYSVELVDAFPTTIGQIDFSNELDGLVELTVQLSYTNWKTISPSQNFINVSVGF